MRVTSSFWVSALIRRSAQAGAFGLVARRGADEAGAIFIILDRLDGTEDLYGPAPQSVFGEERPADRAFQKLVERGQAGAIAERITREVRFDPDLWVITLEDPEGRTPFDIV